MMDEKPYLHLHITLANNNNDVIGGHLNKAIISATFEGFIHTRSETLERTHDPSIGLNLLNL
jgi:hypothetical protein